MNICYIIYDENNNNSIQVFVSDRYNVTIATININQPVTQLTGRNFHVVYCDATFTQSAKGKDLIREIFKPAANLGNKEFYMI